MRDAPANTQHDRAFLCRETIAEIMGPIIIGAEIVQRYCELGDEAGIHYQLGCMAAYFRAAGSAYRGVEHVIRAAGIEDRLARGGPIPLAELDAALNKKAIGTTSRIALKSALGRVGLLSN